jgi:hypothetical protein
MYTDPNNVGQSQLEATKNAKDLTPESRSQNEKDSKEVADNSYPGADRIARMKKAIGRQIPKDNMDPLGQYFAAQLTAFKYWLVTSRWFGWIETNLHMLVSGHVVRQWGSTDGFITIDLDVTAWMIQHRTWFERMWDKCHKLPPLQGEIFWGRLAKAAQEDFDKLRAEFGNIYIRLEVHEKGPVSVTPYTGVCSMVTAYGSIKYDRDGFFECHPTWLGINSYVIKSRNQPLPEGVIEPIVGPQPRGVIALASSMSVNILG